MSTVDPVAERKAREEALRGSTRGALRVLVTALMIVAGGAAISISTSGFYQLGDNPTNAAPPPQVFAFVAAVPLLIGGVAGHLTASRDYTGRLGQAPVIGTLPLGVIGATLGAWWGWATLPQRDLSWIAAAALSVLSLGLIVLSVVSRARTRERARVLRELHATGAHTTGEITEIPVPDPQASTFIAPYVVKFVDQVGTPRWVTRTGYWAIAEVPVVGSPVSVLFDPSDPSDTKRIWVGPPGARTVEDFETWIE